VIRFARGSEVAVRPQLRSAAGWVRHQFALPTVRSHLGLEDLPGRLDELEVMTRDFLALRKNKERHNWRSESAYRRLQMLSAVALIGDTEVRHLVETLTAMEVPSADAYAALANRLTVLRHERPINIGEGIDNVAAGRQ
jgi:hypothetical protein